MTETKKKRLNLELTEEAYQLLQKVAEESGKNMAEVLRTGLALYNLAHEGKAEGKSLALEKDNEIESKIVIP